MGEQEQPLKQYIIDDRGVVMRLQEHGFVCKHDIRGWYLTNCPFTGNMPPRSCTLPDGAVLYEMGTHIVRKGSEEYLKLKREMYTWRPESNGNETVNCSLHPAP